MTICNQDPLAIMPLCATRSEIDGTPDLLRHLLTKQSETFANIDINYSAVRQIILVGSGDSYAVSFIAAEYIEKKTRLRCYAKQTFDFLNYPIEMLTHDTLVLVISASGRPSPVLDALSHALTSSAQTVGITNSPGTPFSLLTKNMIFTHAIKKGIPTQSTSATLLVLCQFAAIIRNTSSGQPHDDTQNKFDEYWQQCASSKKYWQQCDKDPWFTSSVTFLGSGMTWGVALAGANLLSCGPQIIANAWHIEEFYHSLRLNQATEKHHIIMFPNSTAEYPFYSAMAQKLRSQGVSVTCINNTDSNSEIIMLLKNMQWLYEMAWHLAQHFTARGNSRVTIYPK